MGYASSGNALLTSEISAHWLSHHFRGEMSLPGLNAPNQVEADGMNASFHVADAQNLLFQNKEFDIVMSILGVIFAPDQKQAASEVLRVCKPDGKIGLMSHAKGGVVDEMFFAMAVYMPPDGLEPPIRWETEEGYQCSHIYGLQCQQAITILGKRKLCSSKPIQYPFREGVLQIVFKDMWQYHGLRPCDGLATNT